MKRFSFFVMGFSFISPIAFAVDTDQNRLDANEAREEYRTYLREIKRLSDQYKQVTGEMEKIMREEGFPVWDEKTDSLRIAQGGAALSGASASDYRIKENDKEMNVSVDLPGLKKETLKVSIRDSKYLSIAGERKNEDTKLERLVELPTPAADEGLVAVYEDGVLSVTIPKSPESKKEVVVPVK